MSYLRVKFNFKREREREFLDIQVVDIRDLGSRLGRESVEYNRNFELM